MRLYIKKVRDGYIVCRCGSNKHSHFKSEHGAKDFLKFMKKGLLPKSPYFIESAKRVLTEKEFNKLRTKTKQTYHNVNRGVKFG